MEREAKPSVKEKLRENQMKIVREKEERAKERSSDPFRGTDELAKKLVKDDKGR